jgi:hypothetical protein
VHEGEWVWKVDCRRKEGRGEGESWRRGDGEKGLGYDRRLKRVYMGEMRYSMLRIRL